LSLLLQRCYRFWKKLPKKDLHKYNTKINNNSSSSSSSSSSSFVSNPKPKQKETNQSGFKLHLEDRDRNKINPSAMYITSWRIKPKTKIITQSILLHLEIAVEFCQWENCKQISSVSQSFKIPKHPNKTKQKKTHNQACYTIPSSSSSSSFNTKITTKMQTKTHQDLQPKNNQTKHEFFLQF
jgi:hypothetical protein